MKVYSPAKHHWGMGRGLTGPSVGFKPVLEEERRGGGGESFTRTVRLLLVNKPPTYQWSRGGGAGQRFHGAGDWNRWGTYKMPLHPLKAQNSSNKTFNTVQTYKTANVSTVVKVAESLKYLKCSYQYAQYKLQWWSVIRFNISHGLGPLVKNTLLKGRCEKKMSFDFFFSENREKR